MENTQLPTNEELERLILGNLIIEGTDRVIEVSEIISPDYFFYASHREIYSTLLSMACNNQLIDTITLVNKLKELSLLEDCGGILFVSELINIQSTSIGVVRYAEILKDLYMRRELMTIASALLNKSQGQVDTITDVMGFAESAIFNLSASSVKTDYKEIGDLRTEALSKIRDRRNGFLNNITSGVPSGFLDLDAATGGWQNSDLVILAARPAMGKTALLLTMAKNMAIDLSIPVAFFSLEMADLQLTNRIITNISGVPNARIKTGDISDSELTHLSDSSEVMDKAPLFIDDTPSLSIIELRSKAKRLVREHGVKCIMIDYLQLMTAKGLKYGNREQEISTISRSLKALAKELDIPIIALSQLNRGVEARTGDAKRPMLSDLRESGAIEQDADMVVMLHRPEYYGIMANDAGDDMRGKAELVIAKFRSGATGIVNLRFNSELIKFQDIDSQPEENKDDFWYNEL